MGNTIEMRIGKVYTSLSKAHKKTADYVLNNLFRSATMTIDELADAVGVSVATANRFAKALGYDGYSQFRADLVAGFESTLAPVEKLRYQVQRPTTVAEIFASTLKDDIENLEATCRGLNAALCERAVEMILAAERIYIVGFGSSAYLAGLLVHGLESYCPTVQSVAGPGGGSAAARLLAKLTPRDLVIAIAFPRYLTDTVMLSQHVVDRSVPLITLTDGPTSPLAPLSETALYVRGNRQHAANSDAAVLSTLQALCDAVAHCSKDSVHAASITTESVLPWLYEDRPSTTPQAPSPASLKARKPTVKGRPSPVSKKEK